MNSSERLVELAQRKERLITQAMAQRAEVTAAFEGLRGPITAADRVFRAVQFVRAHPLVPALACAALAVLGRRRLLGLVGRGVAVWRTVRLLRSWSRTLA
jgi:hypothetical protein